VQRHGVEDRAYLTVFFMNDFMCDSMMCDIQVFQAALFRFGIDEFYYCTKCVSDPVAHFNHLWIALQIFSVHRSVSFVEIDIESTSVVKVCMIRDVCKCVSTYPSPANEEISIMSLSISELTL
jgi:hypothetical protein